MTKMAPQRRDNSVRTMLELVVVVFLIVVGLNYQTLLDRYALATFSPTTATAVVIERLDLTTQARAVLYRAQVRVEDKEDFNRDCQTTPQELELGCYFRGRIYVLEITNQSLAPEMEVALAHELLHAEWDRYSVSERMSLGGQLEKVYQQSNDTGLKQRMAQYAQTEPGQQDNELHSILGTEQMDLPGALAQHYAQYFPERSQIVAAHEAYTSVFTTQASQLDSELAQIRAQKAELTTLDARMNAYRASGQITVYNALVPQQNALVEQINSEITVYSQGVDEYNVLAASLNSQTLPSAPAAAQ